MAEAIEKDPYALEMRALGFGHIETEEEKIDKVLYKTRRKEDLYPTLQDKIPFGKTKLSDYNLIEYLGNGSYGEVSKYLHKSTGTIVAIKTFKFENCQ